MWLFDVLVWSVVSYEAEIWEWKKWETVEGLQNRYIRWVLGVDKTPGYLVRENMQRDLLRGRASKRAWEFEEKLEKKERSEIARKCLMEVRSRKLERVSLSDWEKERIRFYRNREVSMVEMKEAKKREKWRVRELIVTEKRMQKEERWERIRKSRYNK